MLYSCEISCQITNLKSAQFDQVAKVPRQKCPVAKLIVAEQDMRRLTWQSDLPHLGIVMTMLAIVVLVVSGCAADATEARDDALGVSSGEQNGAAVRVDVQGAAEDAACRWPRVQILSPADGACHAHTHTHTHTHTRLANGANRMRLDV